jgi:hypothetical protein
MFHHTKHRGLYVVIRRDGEEQDLFRWSISRRKTPFGVKLTKGGFRSHHAARAAGSKVLEELVENILREEKNVT